MIKAVHAKGYVVYFRRACEALAPGKSHTLKKADLAYLAQEALHVFIDELELALVKLNAHIDATYFENEPQTTRTRAAS